LPTHEPLVLARVDTAIALASGGTRQIGAEYSRGVHDDPPGVVGEYAKKEYVWTPIFMTSATHRGLVERYPCIQLSKFLR